MPLPGAVDSYGHFGMGCTTRCRPQDGLLRFVIGYYSAYAFG